MQELHVPTHRIHVEVFATDGSRVAGCLFMHASPYLSDPAQDLAHELHDERRFLPLVPDGAAGGAPLVINKEHILRLHVPWSAALRPDEFAEAVPATLRLADGSRFEGRLAFATPARASRLIDKLNLAPSFVPFAGADGLDFIRRSHIVHAS